MRIYHHYSVTSTQKDDKAARFNRTDENSQGTVPFSAYLDEETQEFVPGSYDEDDENRISPVMSGRVSPVMPMGMQRPEGIPTINSMSTTEA